MIPSRLSLEAARDAALRACTSVLVAGDNLAVIEESLASLDLTTRLLIARSLACELLQTMHLTGELKPDLLDLIVSSISQLPDSPNQGLFGAANDYSTVYLLKRLGIADLETDDPANLALSMDSDAGMYADWAQATCNLAIPGLYEPWLCTAQKRWQDLAQAVCIAIMEHRYLRASRQMRWLALLEHPELDPFRDATIQWLAAQPEVYHEVLFHLAIIQYRKDPV